jgi:hypothetical protein
LDGIEENKIAEDFSPLGNHPTKNNEENKCEMTPEISEPREYSI